MKLLTFDYQQTSQVTQQELNASSAPLIPIIQSIKKNLESGYETPYAPLYLPYQIADADDEIFQSIKDTADNIKKLNPTLIIVIGIGGSNLGTIAVQEALLGKFYNFQPNHMKIHYADTVDSDYIWDIYLLAQQELEADHSIIINVVSKSGTTLETIANVEIFIELLQSYVGDEFNNYIVATTDNGSALWHYAQNKKITCLEIPENVGGRYSVFSAVSLFPLALIGIDIDSLLFGARTMLEHCLTEQLEVNYAAISASLLYIYYKRNITVHNSFIFSVDLASVGAWYRQLIGESLGKEKDKQGNVVHVGITPLVSIGSTDLHSVGQLYLSGRKDIFTTFINVDQNKSACQIPNQDEIAHLVKGIANRDLTSLMHVIVQGTQQAYQEKSLPFATITLPEKSAYYIGQLLQLNMCQIIYAGHLLNINPFDQPNVEAYKKNVRKILAHE